MGVERDYEGFEPLFAVGVYVSVAASPGFPAIYIAASASIIAATGLLFLLHRHKNNLSVNPIRILVPMLALAVGIFCGLNGHLSKSGSAVELPFLSIGQSFQYAIDRIPFRNQDVNSLIKALLTGNRQALPHTFTEAFRASGASHILALSGLHLGIIYGIILKATSIIGNSTPAKLARAIITIVICCIYTLATGAGASITRALIFITLRETGKIMTREPDLKDTLTRSLVIQLAARPYDIIDIGFQLSYAAMAGIAWIHPLLKKLWHEEDHGFPLKTIWESASVSISCQLTTGPLAYLYFKTFPMYFMLTNLLAVPLTGIIIPAGLLTMTLSAAGICPDLLITGTELAAEALIYILETIAAM